MFPRFYWVMKYLRSQGVEFPQDPVIDLHFEGKNLPGPVILVSTLTVVVGDNRVQIAFTQVKSILDRVKVNCLNAAIR